MSPTSSSCRQIAPDLLRAAMGEASPPAAERVEEHVRRCAACRDQLHRSRDVDRLVTSLGRTPVVEDRSHAVRGDLEWRLAELRRRAVTCRVWNSPLGPILIARSERGVVLVEYLPPSGDLRASRLHRFPGIEVVEDGTDTEAFYQQLLEYLSGERTRLAWPLDLRFAASDFHREVLDATAALPYGAVTSYGRIAREIGRPRAVRAVAQALRRNPLPIVVPCHRVIGGSGSLTGYAGNKVDLKERLLAVEGVRTAHAPHDARILRAAMYTVADRDTEYCLPTCGSLPTLPLARLTLFGTRERAEAAGLAPCTSCRPDLHPLSA
jgi:methylated-DNA-[protein]-cysteine S-methyltransferase